MRNSSKPIVSKIDKDYAKLLSGHLPEVQRYKERNSDRLTALPAFCENPFFIKKNAFDRIIKKTKDLLGLIELLGDFYLLNPDFLEDLKDLKIKSLKNYFVERDRTQAHIARPDIIFSKNGPKLIEFNVSSAVEGGYFSEACHQYFSQHPTILSLKKIGKYRLTSHSHARLFSDNLRSVLPSDRLTMWDLATPPEDPADAKYISDFCNLVFGRNFKLNYLGPKHRYNMKNVKPHQLKTGDMLFRLFHPSLIDLQDQNYASVLNKLKKGIVSDVAGLSEIVYSNKVLMSDLFHYLQLLAGQKKYRDLMDLIPETIAINDFSLKGCNESLISSNRHRWVLKQGASYSSKQVYLGCNMTATNWNILFARAKKEGGWILQSFSPMQTYKGILLESNGTLREVARTVQIGPFMINKKYSGTAFWSSVYEKNLSLACTITAGILYE